MSKCGRAEKPSRESDFEAEIREEELEQAVGGTQQKNIPGDVNSMCQRQTEHDLSEAL